MQPPSSAPTVEHESRLAYLRGNSLGGLLLSLAALGSSLFAVIPPLAFIAAALTLGAFTYATWTRPVLKPHLFWLAPVVVGGGVWFAVHASFGMPKALGMAQFVSSLAVGMFGCFAMERLRRRNPQ